MSIEKGRVSTLQATFLVTNTILATTLLFLPGILAEEVGQDSWLALFLAAIFGFLLGWLVISLGRKFPGKNLVEYGRELLGLWPGRFLGVLLGVFWTIQAAIVVREFGELLGGQIMHETPMLVFNVLLVLMAVYGIYLGLEVFARVSEIVVPVSLAVGLLVWINGLPEMDFGRLQPSSVHSCAQVLRGSGDLLSFYSQGVVLAMFLPYLRRPGEAHWIVVASSVLLAVAILLSILGVIAFFGVEETSRMMFPAFEFAEAVRFPLVERIEALVVGIWVATTGIKVMVISYSGVLAFASSLNLEDYRPLVLPIGLLLAVLSASMFSDTAHLREFMAHYASPYGNTFQVGIPLLLYILALFQRKDG